MTEINLIEQRENHIKFFELKNDALRVVVTNLGCHIISIFAKDRNGIAEDVVLGFEDVEDTINDGSYMGAIVGRVANRIRGASFSLNGKTYELAANNGPNHLHGGIHGFHSKLFSYELIEDGIVFSYKSDHMEEGYPGNLIVYITYKLEENTFKIHYAAVSDQDTICNLTSHSYFNLSGGKEKIYDHELQIDADEIACVDENCCTTGKFMNVEKTPFDFHEYHKIGERIREDCEQLNRAGGYDHSFMVRKGRDQVKLYEPKSGRKLIISTTMPAVQVYSANFLSGGCNGKHGRPYENRDGVALETQFLPDSIHIEENPQVILRAGKRYTSETSYRFEVE